MICWQGTHEMNWIQTMLCYLCTTRGATVMFPGGTARDSWWQRGWSFLLLVAQLFNAFILSWHLVALWCVLCVLLVLRVEVVDSIGHYVLNYNEQDFSSAFYHCLPIILLNLLYRYRCIHIMETYFNDIKLCLGISYEQTKLLQVFLQ